MESPLRLRKRHLLPEKAVEVARIIKKNQPITREELEKQIEKTEELRQEDIRENVRMLRMTENLEIENEKAKVKPVTCKGVGNSVMSKFRRWKREAQNS